MKKVIRSISGITPLAVMLKPYPCPHGKCIYCPSQENVPESYTTTSPVVLRATDCGWDAKRQVEARLKILGEMGHLREKIELIVMGGTFSTYPADYQKEFIKGLFDGLNGCISPTLEQSQKMNELAKHRAVGLCLETRPDYCTREDIKRFLEYGATRVELGVQTLDDKIQEFTHRGHGTKEVADASQLLKDSCFKVGYHMMLGLPGSDPKKDIETIKTLYSDHRFQPDHLKLYPTFVIKNTPLERLYYNGEYEPYTTEQIVDTLIEIKKIVPKYTRIMRVMRDIPKEHIVSKCYYSHLRSEVKDRMNEAGLKCNCIRCREVGHVNHQKKKFDPGSIELVRQDYMSSNGKEIFLTYEDTANDVLVSMLRLRIPYKPVSYTHLTLPTKRIV